MVDFKTTNLDQSTGAVCVDGHFDPEVVTLVEAIHTLLGLTGMRKVTFKLLRDDKEHTLFTKISYEARCGYYYHTEGDPDRYKGLHVKYHTSVSLFTKVISLIVVDDVD